MVELLLKMTQARFSDTFGFSLDAIKHWEGGRRTPEAPARTLLTVIAKNPAAVINSKMVHVGDRVGDAKVIAIDRDSVTIEADGKRRVLTFF